MEINGSNNTIYTSTTYVYENSFNDNSTKNESGGCAIAGLVVFFGLIGGGATILIALIGMVTELLR